MDEALLPSQTRKFWLLLLHRYSLTLPAWAEWLLQHYRHWKSGEYSPGRTRASVPVWRRMLRMALDTEYRPHHYLHPFRRPTRVIRNRGPTDGAKHIGPEEPTIHRRNTALIARCTETKPGSAYAYLYSRRAALVSDTVRNPLPTNRSDSEGVLGSMVVITRTRVSAGEIL
ncbi:hypothetical protein EJ03DRAFT_223331 [Teratosphaeria nubilosa]|uniref:Uncharacterized protein n=1 Tax=Teratosphaeria nubilosa TaxID=161662 RepID=A0A6G1KXC9_9PEZI|nr:hypothetical protein EJ03DRAFT_223331 [Teratosphaeria nubilosa]